MQEEEDKQPSQSADKEEDTQGQAAADEGRPASLANQLYKLSLSGADAQSGDADVVSDSAQPTSPSPFHPDALPETLAGLLRNLSGDWGEHTALAHGVTDNLIQAIRISASIEGVMMLGRKYEQSKPKMSALLFAHAAHLEKMSRSSTAAVAAEVEIFASKFAKLETGRIELLELREQGTDAYYLQLKAGGIYVRQEVKSVTAKGDELRAIIDAEVQHQVRLSEEDDKPTWHKTTLVINNAENTWPLSGKEKQACEGKAPEAVQDLLMRAALKKVTPLLFGSNKPRKTMDESYSKLSPERVQHLKEAHVMQWKNGEGICKQAEVNTKVLASNGIYKEEAYVDGKGSTATPKESYRRCLLVTERIRIVNNQAGWIIALDRVEHGFVASMKMYGGKLLPKTEIKHPRRHWDIPGDAGYRGKQRPLDNGDTPFHIAARQDDVRAFRTMIEAHRDWLVEMNHQERIPLHEAVLNGKAEAVRFLLDEMDEIKFDRVDTDGNSLLHLAAQSNNLEVVKLILAAGKGFLEFDTENKAGQTVLDLEDVNPEIKTLIQHAQEEIDASPHGNLYLGS